MTGAGTGWEPRCWECSCSLGGRYGGDGCGRSTGSCGSCDGTGSKTGWHIWLSAQSVQNMVSVVKNVGTPVDIMMVSKTFEM